MEVIQAGVYGQLAGHSLGWILSGKSLSDITSQPELMMAGLAIASELSLFVIGTRGLNALAPNVAQAGAIYLNRGMPSQPLRDPQLMGSVGSAIAKTLHAYSM